MKKVLAAAFAIYCLFTTVNGQTVRPIRQDAIGINFFLNDFITPDRIRNQSINAVFRDRKWAKFREMSAGIGINYFHGMTPHIDFAATLGGSFVNYPFRNRPPFADNGFLLELDATAQFKLVNENYWVIPYLTAGVGGHMYKVYYGAYMPIGLGLRFNVFDEAGLFVQSQYRIPVTYETSNYYFNNSIGIYGIVGKKKEEVIPPPPIPAVEPVDTDKDGITDDKDKCPTTPGAAKYDGCPVPDTDKDGINDDDDKCPTVPGVARYQGCPVPDTDKDGISDEEDKCPTVAGVARYQGCPVPDTDGDGVNDEEDKCPSVPGLKENQGCPAIQEEVKQKVDVAASNIYFVTGSAKLLAKSNKGLNDVVKILKDNPDMKLNIDGHTDDIGSNATNQKLSETRANAVKTYMVSKGVDPSRINAVGHGEEMPIAPNTTAAGRQKNRRVEMKLGY